MAQTTDRIARLLDMLAKQPGDTFLLYALAQEYRKVSDWEKCRDYLLKVLELDAGQTAAWQQLGQTHEQLGDLKAARNAYVKGIAAARAGGERHAQDKLQGALDAIDRFEKSQAGA